MRLAIPVHAGIDGVFPCVNKLPPGLGVIPDDDGGATLAGGPKQVHLFNGTVPEKSNDRVNNASISKRLGLLT